jgi:hypothetical protein
MLPPASPESRAGDTHPTAVTTTILSYGALHQDANPIMESLNPDVVGFPPPYALTPIRPRECFPDLYACVLPAQLYPDPYK